VHRLNVEAEDFEQAAQRAAEILDYWQRLTKLGVDAAFVGSTPIQFRRLREKGGNIAPRLILTFSVDHASSRHAYLSIAISDPIDSLVRYFLEGGPEPTEWTEFKQHALPYLRTRSGRALLRVKRASLTINARAADMGDPAQVGSGATFDDFIMIHAWTHRKGSIDQLTFEKREFIGASALRGSGAIAGNYGPFAGWDLSATSTSGVLGFFGLSDFVGGLTLRVWYAQIGTSPGDIVWRLAYRTFVPGDPRTDEFVVVRTFTPVLGGVLAYLDFSIPDDNVGGAVGIAFRLDRLGADPADTQPNLTTVFGVEAIYQAVIT
jgi:hypothetical protein